MVLPSPVGESVAANFIDNEPPAPRAFTSVTDRGLAAFVTRA
jgi:hypothetical protein